MNRVILVLLPVLLLSWAAPANAQATRTWVSGVGDDANPCSRTAPCKTFAGAISKTAANGEINVIDNGAFGAVTITKAITINAEYNEAGVLATATNGIVINAGVNDVVILRGLDIDGSPGAGVSPGLNGIRFLAGAALHVERCLIRNFRGVNPNGFGILFAPSGASELFVNDTSINNNGDTAASTGGGIGIIPTGAGSAKVVVTNSRLDNNRFGLRAASTSSTGAQNITLDRSSVSGSTNSAIFIVTAAAAGVPINVMVNQTIVASNATGLNVSGNAATLRVGNSVVTGNAQGVQSASGGVLLSYKNNMIDGNPANGTPIPQVNLN
jgi:hypothetical protein